MKLPRRAFLPVTAGVAVLPVAAQVARAQTYPAGGLPKTINVADFGARANGRTDDTAALNAAYASLAGKAGTVIWPAGTYRTTDTVNCGVPTGGSGAPISFISTLGMGGANFTTLNYAGP